MQLSLWYPLILCEQVRTCSSFDLNFARLTGAQLHDIFISISSEFQHRELRAQQQLSEVEHTIVTKAAETAQAQAAHIAAVMQQAELEQLIEWLYEDMLEVIHASVVSQAKVEGLVTALKASLTKVQVVKVDLELHIASVQAKIQPETPPEVHAQRAGLVTEATNSITM